jgi:predicted nicotinamide N-methyase
LGESLLGGKRVVELGSGPGLGALVAARWAQSVLLTDYQDIVLDLMFINMQRCNPRPDACTLSCAKLDWTKVTDEGYFESIEIFDPDRSCTGRL